MINLADCLYQLVIVIHIYTVEDQKKLRKLNISWKNYRRCQETVS